MTAPSATWTGLAHPSPVGVAERQAIGTTIRVVVADPERSAVAASVVDTVLDRLDLVASRFRPDSELSRLNALASGGGTFLLSRALREHLAAALGAARWTGGLVDPTVASALAGNGYDRDFAALDPDDPRPAAPARPAPGWRSAHLVGSLLELDPGVQLDLGSTAKALGADQAARQAAERCGCPVLVAFGGDLAVAPDEAASWPVVVEEAAGTSPGCAPQLVHLARGGLATSSVTRRRWRRAGAELHHVIDPRTGSPARTAFRTVTVAAPTCLEANVASTAALVAGGDAVGFLERSGLPARLVDHGGRVRLLGGFPEKDGSPLPEVREPLLARGQARGWWR